MIRSKSIPHCLAASVIVLGSLTIGGWIFGINWLKTVFPGVVSMKPSTALCWILAGGSLWLQADPTQITRRRLLCARAMAGFVIAAALLTLVEYAFGVDVGLDRLLVHAQANRAGDMFPGRMSLSTGIDFVLLGAALLSLDVQIRDGGAWPAHYFTLGAAAVTLLAFVGYFYGVESFSRLGPYSAIAFHTVVASWLLCVGILFARPQHGVMAVFTSDRLGGLLARRMLPAAILVPFLGGWLRVMGQRSGLYGLGFGSALYATLLTVTFTTLVVWAAGALNRADAERSKGADALRQTNARLESSREKLRGLTARLQAVREEERTQIAREIHDVLAQELTRLKMDIAWLNRQLGQPIDEPKKLALKAKLAGMSEVTDTAITSVQRIATELRPVVLDTLGLCAAVEWQAKDFEARTGIACRVSVPESDLRLTRDYSTALFRILQESLTNVARHAKATRVEVDLSVQNRWLCLTIQDNGRGVRAVEINDPHSLGLLGMRERASLLGGECLIAEAQPGGTRVEARLPAPAVDSLDDTGIASA